jgi:hypothetical protein
MDLIAENGLLNHGSHRTAAAASALVWAMNPTRATFSLLNTSAVTKPGILLLSAT